MKLPTKRYVHFHGTYKDKYYDKVLEIHADSMFNLFNILFVEVFPELKDEKHLSLVFEDTKGNTTDVFDAEQELHESQTILHIMPNPDGAYVQIVYAVIMAIISYGVAMMLAPKTDSKTSTASGNIWDTPENVIGQGGVIPVTLGTRLVGSRVASYGIDSTVKMAKERDTLETTKKDGTGLVVSSSLL